MCSETAVALLGLLCSLIREISWRLVSPIYFLSGTNVKNISVKNNPRISVPRFHTLNDFCTARYHNNFLIKILSIIYENRIYAVHSWKISKFVNHQFILTNHQKKFASDFCTVLFSYKFSIFQTIIRLFTKGYSFAKMDI